MKKLIILTACLVGVVLAPALVSGSAGAVVNPCVANPTAPGCKKQDQVNTVLDNIIDVMIYGAGITSVAGIIYGAVLYTTSAGAADKVSKAKNAIMYSVIGLVVAILAFSIVNFVLKAIK